MRPCILLGLCLLRDMYKVVTVLSQSLCQLQDRHLSGTGFALNLPAATQGPRAALTFLLLEQGVTPEQDL